MPQKKGRNYLTGKTWLKTAGKVQLFMEKVCRIILKFHGDFFLGMPITTGRGEAPPDIKAMNLLSWRPLAIVATIIKQRYFVQKFRRFGWHTTNGNFVPDLDITIGQT